MPTTHVILGAGPVGRAVVTALAGRGIEPAVVTRTGTAVPGAISRPADLTDPVQAAAAVAGADVVFQCAQPGYHRWPQEFPGLQARARRRHRTRRGTPGCCRESLRLRTHLRAAYPGPAAHGRHPQGRGAGPDVA